MAGTARSPAIFISPALLFTFLKLSSREKRVLVRAGTMSNTFIIILCPDIPIGQASNTKRKSPTRSARKVFSKLLALISAAAKTEPNPNFNPRLRTAIATAKEMAVPQDNIERAIKKASEADNNLEELIFEAYGPGGIAILIEAVSDNKNRAVQEIKTILKDHNGKWAETGSVQWAFENADPRILGANGYRTAKFPQDIPGPMPKNLFP